MPIAFPQADATLRRVFFLRNMASAVWGMTQHRDPGSCSFSSLPRATNPRLSSSVSSPLCPTFAGTQGKWLQMTIVCVTPFRGSLHLQLSLPRRQKHCCFSTARCYLGSFLALVWWAVKPSLGFRPHTSQGNPVATEISLQNLSCCLWEPSQPSQASTLPTSLEVVMWLLP